MGYREPLEIVKNNGTARITANLLCHFRLEYSFFIINSLEVSYVALFRFYMEAIYLDFYVFQCNQVQMILFQLLAQNKMYPSYELENKD